MGEVTADGDVIIGRIRPKNNPLIHRSEVGKPSFHNDMPPLPAHYTFGAPLKKDPEGAGEVMLTWHSHQPSPAKQCYDFGRDFLTLNKRSVKSGCISSKDIATFRKSNDARIKPKVTGKKPLTVPDHVIQNKDYAYGCKSSGSECVADLIQNRYELEWVEDQRKKSAETDKKREAEKQRRASPKRKMAEKQRSASALAAAANTSPSRAETFTLPKFRNVPSRFLTPSPTFAAAAS